VLTTVAAAWAVVFGVGLSRQDFPLSDDFSFGRLAFRFAHGEGVRYDGWPSMPLLGQWVWATPFIRVLGDSFVALRLASVVLAGLGLVATFDLVRSEPGVSVRAAAFAAAAIAFNPYVFVLSGTFLSDLPALSFSLIALALLRRGAAAGRLGAILAGGVAAVLATTTRQNALAAPLAAAVLPAKGPRVRRIALLLGSVAPAVAGLAVAAWFGRRPDVSPRSIYSPTLAHMAEVILRHAYVLGLSAVPVLLLSPRRILRADFLFWVTAFGVGTLAWLELTYRTYLQPYLKHLQFLPGDFITAVDVFSQAPPLVEKVSLVGLTVAGCFGLAGLFAGPGGGARVGGAGRSLLVFSLLQLGLMGMTRPVYDRYFIVLLPAVVLRTIPRRSPSDRPWWWAGLAALTVVAAVSVGVMHDWLASNAARWELGRRAVARGVAPEDIDGSLPWDGWYSPQAFCPLSYAEQAALSERWNFGYRPRPIPPSAFKPDPKSLAPPFTRMAFPLITGHYAICRELPETTTIDSLPYRTWLPPGLRRHFLIRKD
jgi:4-amino-4-deoxy-L-arabinose transferase-like glycosyltransferase